MPYPLSGYSVGGASSQVSSGAASTTESKDKKGYWSLQRLRRSYLDYLGTKREEIDEQQDARRMVHGSQWTSKQIADLNARRQPVTTNNYIIKKINGVVGTLERLKQDPKAYARTPKHEQGADLATAALRYALEAQSWPAKDARASMMCAIDGFGGLEFNLIEGDQGDVDIEIDVVEVDSFFYDPRSYRPDFSDARFMGIGKWMDLDAAIELFPDFEEELQDSVEVGDDLSSEPDREHKWFHSYGEVRRVRVVDVWYRHRGKWCYCIFTGNTKLIEGTSPFVDEKGETQCKYEMYSCYIDQDGDRYGLVRNLKTLQQQINMRESKALYSSLSRGIVAEKGAFDDIEVARREAARSDGVVIRNKGFEAEFNDQMRSMEIEAQFKFLENIKKDFNDFGPNLSLLGQGLENASGRAIHLLQQAGLADLGPFIQSYRDWKIRVYRKMWNAIQRHWTGERWVRVTDDDDLTQYIQVNGVGVDPMTGMPTLVNALGSLDVDIILDEGPDAVNIMADAYETLKALVQGGTQIPPNVLIELAPLPSAVKKKTMEMMNPSDPQSQQRQQRASEAQIAQVEAEVQQKYADAKLKEAQAVKALSDAQRPDATPEGVDPEMRQMELFEKQASIEKTRAETEKVKTEAAIVPVKLEMEQRNKEREMQFNAQAKEREFQQKDADRNEKARQADQKTVISLDGTMADKMDAHAKNNTAQVSELGKSLVAVAKENAAAMEKAADTFAQSAQLMAKAMTSKKKLIRDPKTGRAMGVESE